MAFCLEFLKTSVQAWENANRNADIELDEDIQEGRPIHKSRAITLTEKELEIEHRYVLMNTAILTPYVE